MGDNMNEIFIKGIKLDHILSECENPYVYCKYAILNLISSTKNKNKILEDLVRKVNSRFETVRSLIIELLNLIKDSLEKQYEKVIEVTLITKSRLIVGSNNDSTALLFETGTMLHPVLGIPYIPGSSIKGVIRSYLESLSKSELKEKLDVEVKSVDDILGKRGVHASYLLVTDAYPISTNKYNRLIEPEVTTPIYKDNIEEHKAKPVPIIYPVIAPGVKFRFYMVATKRAVNDTLDKLTWFNSLAKLMIVITREGIGGKTMLGYGSMEVISI